MMAAQPSPMAAQPGSCEQSPPLQQSQRVQVELEGYGQAKCVRIRVESHDDCLGWYTSASVSVPMGQLPLLEQALAGLSRPRFCEGSAKIIPFPGVAAGAKPVGEPA